MSERSSDDEIMQQFVYSLLSSDKGMSTSRKARVVAKPLVDNDKISTNQPNKTHKVLSERLKIAQNLLQDMPLIRSEEAESDLKPMVTAQNPTIKPLKLKERLDLNIKSKIINTETDIVALEQNKVSKAEINENPKYERQKSENKQPKVNLKSAWGKGSFQTLIFKVGEIKLAVPLVKLGGIHRLDPNITHIAGQPDWYMGLTRDQIGNLSVIDTALWIMPDRLPVAKEIRLDYEYVVLLDDTRWALACGSVQDALMIKEDDVKWSSQNSKRPWLAGMLIDQMCALLDVDVLVEMLEQLSNKNIAE